MRVPPSPSPTRLDKMHLHLLDHLGSWHVLVGGTGRERTERGRHLSISGKHLNRTPGSKAGHMHLVITHDAFSKVCFPLWAKKPELCASRPDCAYTTKASAMFPGLHGEQVRLTTRERGLFQETTPMSPDSSTWRDKGRRKVRCFWTFNAQSKQCGQLQCEGSLLGHVHAHVCAHTHTYTRYSPAQSPRSPSPAPVQKCTCTPSPQPSLPFGTPPPDHSNPGDNPLSLTPTSQQAQGREEVAPPSSGPCSRGPVVSRS